jgi:hypothetical protein
MRDETSFSVAPLRVSLAAIVVSKNSGGDPAVEFCFPQVGRRIFQADASERSANSRTDRPVTP